MGALSFSPSWLPLPCQPDLVRAYFAVTRVEFGECIGALASRLSAPLLICGVSRFAQEARGPPGLARDIRPFGIETAQARSLGISGTPPPPRTSRIPILARILLFLFLHDQPTASPTILFLIFPTATSLETGAAQARGGVGVYPAARRGGLVLPPFKLKIQPCKQYRCCQRQHDRHGPY